MSSDPAHKYALQQVQLQEPDDCKPYIIIPKSSRFVDMEKRMDAPRQITATVSFADFQDFLNYIKTYREPSTTAFWAQGIFSGRIVAIIDYHARAEGANHARWCEHVAMFKARKMFDYAKKYEAAEPTPIYKVSKLNTQQR